MPLALYALLYSMQLVKAITRQYGCSLFAALTFISKEEPISIALHAACRKGHTGVAEMLQINGAQSQFQMWDPLVLRFVQSYVSVVPSVVEILPSQGADVDANVILGNGFIYGASLHLPVRCRAAASKGWR